MSKLIRRKKEIGAALAAALQLTTLTLIGVIGQYAAADGGSGRLTDDCGAAGPNRPSRTRNRPKRPACFGCLCKQAFRSARHASI